MHNQIDNLITFNNSQNTEARGTLLKLSRTTIIFEVYNPYSIVQLSEVLQNLVIRRNKQAIYQGKAVVSNLVNTGLMLVVSATLVDPWLDLAEISKSNKELNKEIAAFISDWQEAHNIRPGYQLAVGEIRAFLSELSRWLEQLDLTRDGTTPLATETLDCLNSPISPKVQELLQQFELEAAKIPPSDVAAHKTFAQRDLHPLIMGSPFTHRIFNKPLGYAGDFEMVKMIWENAFEGPTTYAQLINKLHLQFDAAEAHRNRINVLTDRLIQTCEKSRACGRPARILNIGCGPAIEVHNFIHRYPLPEQAHLDLMDFNQETLDTTQRRISDSLAHRLCRPTLEFILCSVYTLLKQAATRSLEPGFDGKYDLVYCAGLFDYLTDKACTQLLQIFYNWTAPGGKVLATNVHPDNSGTQWMEHLLEWHLIYRTEEEMKTLAPKEVDKIIYCDPTGVNVFMEFEKV